MRPLTLSGVLFSAAFLIGCKADEIQAPSSSAEGARLERGWRPTATDFDFSTIDVPNSVFTAASGIGPGGDIVGTYVDASQQAHGFLLRDGVFTSIDYPGAAGTEARGIGPDGDIVGDYWNEGEPMVNLHGYRRTARGEFIAVNYPDHTSTIVQRVLPDGTLLGCRHDENMTSSMKGVVIERSSSREITQFASMINGGTPNGQRLVGLYTNTSTGLREGFVIDDGVFTPLKVPGSSVTAAWDINPLGEIVGVYRNSTGAHGFLLQGEDYTQGENYTTIDFPGASSTTIFGINARGDIVGSYVAGGITHGFVGRR
jgi:uncharacterized membrane protein